MPGLSGRVGGSCPDDALATAERLEHFPFYTTVTAGDDNVWLGWAGIGTAAGHLLNDRERGVLAGYHGDRGDACLEQVVSLASERPLDLAETLDGSFAAAHYDRTSGELTLVTDPFGHHRVYYIQREDVLHFAPELKGLLGRPGLDLAVDPASLRDLMNYTYPLVDRTSLAGVKLLPPASVLRFRDGVLRVETYWSPVYDPVEGEDEELAARGYELFAAAFEAKVASGRPVVCPVSGGLDSRLLLAEALRRGHEVRAYTYGHAASREAQVALQVMAAAGVGDRFVTLDDFPEPDTALATGSWFCEGMTNLTASALVGINHHLRDEPRDALFLNGIYGGPTNFSAAYHKPDELTDQFELAEKVRRVGRTIFSHRLHNATAYRILQPEFARTCDEAYVPELTRAFAPWQQVSPLFGHQKDAFLIANRMCRFMNQVDLNRYYWDEAIPLTSFALYRFYLRLPDRLKFGRLLHRRIVAGQFPAMADVVNFNSGRTINEELAGAPPRRIGTAGAQLRHWLGRLTRGALSSPDPESYEAPGHYLRRNRPLRDFVGDILTDPGFLSDDVFDRRVVQDYFERTLRGAQLASTVFKVLAWELWRRQVASGRREVG